MLRIISVLFMISVVTACSDQEEDKLLSGPPYKSLTDSIGQAPQDAGLYYRRGFRLYRDNQLSYAEKDLRKAWELEAKEEYAAALVTVLEQQKKTDEATRFGEEALQKLPNSLFLQVQLAKAYDAKGETDKALQLSDQVIGRYPNNIDMQLLKANILSSKGDERASLETLENAYKYAPGDVELVHMLAFAYAEASNPKALSLSDSLIRVDVEKSHAEPYFFKGVYYSNTGNYTEATRQFDIAIRTNHYYMSAYINKGIIYYDQKKYDQAMQVFELALNVSPDYADAYYWIGKTQEATGNKVDARSNYQRAYNIDKTMIEAKQAADRL